MRKKLSIFFALLAVLAVLMPTWVEAKTATLKIDSNTTGMTKAEKSVYKKMKAMNKKYPEGKKWTDSKYYEWKGGYYTGGYGCAAFAFKVSDAAFGDKPCRVHKSFKKIKVGDIVNIDYGAHYVIVMKVVGKKYVVAEGNYDRKVGERRPKWIN